MSTFKSVLCVEEQFNEIADEWNRETKYYLFRHMICRHRAYSKLLAFGLDAIPFVLRRAENNSSINWSFLLYDLTEEQPEYETLLEDNFTRFKVNPAIHRH